MKLAKVKMNIVLVNSSKEDPITTKVPSPQGLHRLFTLMLLIHPKYIRGAICVATVKC